MSQKSALPSAIAACRSLMKSAKFAGYPVNLDRTPTINIVATAPRESDLFRRIDLRLSVTMNIAAEGFALDRIDGTH